MEEVIKKADVLVEALPYIRAFHNKIFVIKYGGRIMLNERARKNLLEDLSFIYFVGIKPILIHGGGPFISRRARSLARPIQFLDGRRVTDKAMLKIVEETLQEINLGLVNTLKALCVNATGLNGARDKIIKVKKFASKIDLGFVGEVETINSLPIKEALKKKLLPIIIPLGIGRDNSTYNVNADEVASEIATALKAEKFILLTNVRGILLHREDEDSLISTLTQKEAEELINRGVIQEGMLPKVKACIYALNNGVKKTHIIDGRLSHALLLEIFTQQGVGTEIIDESSKDKRS